eukprot:TRINITY_DN5781_c1_g2_i1.p1 TRINITY_DN5781_c1_g2~~TRINITY_DN5781_c1_g2_i1.p1  ORF type:complete len:3148 (-),score=914.00 TRINITY_DN5781_c1_g2_i1:20-9082(-)
MTEEDHWPKLFHMLELPAGVKLKDLKLSHFLEERVTQLLLSKEKAIKELAARANGEVVIRKSLEDLAYWGNGTQFTLSERKDESQPSLIREWKQTMTEVSDNQATLSSLKDSQYFAAFKSRAEEWEDKMSLLADALQQLNIVQRKWVYLAPIFARGALPHEQGRFQKIDREFREIMSNVESDPRVLSLIIIPDISKTLDFLVKQLDHCQKALSEYLEEKRAKFPRFYFIGDDDLLEILGQAQNPAVIRSHLKKLFQGIHDVSFSRDNKQILSMRSVEGEEVPLSKPVHITVDIEGWLATLAEEMKETLAKLLLGLMKSSGLDLDAFPSQLICLSQQIQFSVRAEQAIQQRSLPNLLVSLRDELQQFTSIDVSNSHILRLKVQALVLDIVHMISVVEQLIQAGTQNVVDWMWAKQLRFYMDKSTGKCFAMMCEARFPYTYEYQGNAPKLVHTPLTDKCYLTLTQGMAMGYGGNPYGPAGTGKTESVKALANALGRQVLVFNCDEGIDFKSMGRIFIGLVKCGAWGCFDEFNRLEEEVLSAVSQQIQIIQTSIKSGDRSFVLLNKEVEVNTNAGIFVTLNPAGKGYGGRSKLPDNLKQLFRPVVMTIPDNELIAEVMLYSVGYTIAKELGSKMVSLFMLCKQLLSPQQHYDWGLRAVKAVLGVAGQLILEEKRGGTAVSPTVERELVVKALRVNTLSKLTYQDAQLFQQLVVDVFSGVQSADIVYADLEAAIKQAIQQEGLQVLENQVRKVLQFFEALRQRMGVVIVGPSGCGKTTLWRLLKNAFAILKKPLVVHTMNPKAMPRQLLLGHMDMDTREWFDGVLTNAARQVTREPDGTQSWIVCDGDIDPEWIESLNSVLDDNRLLTLPNGERIQFGNNVNFIFETSDLKYASPATISRMGMLLLSDEDLDFSVLVQTWLAQRGSPPYWNDDIFSKSFKAAQSKAQRGSVIPTTKAGMLMNALSHVVGVSSRSEFVAGLIRGFGANLTAAMRAELTSQLYQIAGETPVELSVPTQNRISPAELQSSPMVPTVDVVRNLAHIAPWLESLQPVLIVGPEGCGKSMLLQSFFQRLKNVSVATIHCSAQTTAHNVKQKLAQGCNTFNTNTGRVLRPKEGERLILYLKDINLPKPDKYATSQLIAFLQQLLTYRGYFDDSLEWVGVERVQVVATMNPATTVGRHALSQRFTAIVRLFNIDYPEMEQLRGIYTLYLDAAISKQCPRTSTQQLAATLVTAYELVRKHFKTEVRPHYLFTPRDLTQWVQSLTRYDLSDDNILEIWAYEGARLIKDRLVESKLIGDFDKIIAKALADNRWGAAPRLDDVLYASVPGSLSQAKLPLMARTPLPEWAQRVAEGLKTYEREFRELNLLLFPEILQHVAKLDRVLSQPRGSLLLVGRSGAGRRTATFLACHMNRIDLFTPSVSVEYTVKAFGTDIKKVLAIAGVQNRPVALFVEDHQLGNPAFLEYINSLLSAGEVPGLYAQDELQALLGELKEQMTDAGFFGSLLEFFVSRVQTNLHIVLSLDSTSPKFVENCERNPALITRTTIQWWDDWSDEGMKELATARLKPILQAGGVGTDQIVAAVKYIHRSRNAPPRDYVTFVDAYKKQYEAKHEAVSKQSAHLESGLSKLREAAQTVNDLSRAAGVQQQELEVKQKQADEAMSDIQKTLEEIGRRKVETQQLQKKLAREEQEASESKVQAQQELSSVQPIMDAAKKAVGSIDQRHLTELRSLPVPPAVVKDILEGVLVLLNNTDNTWEGMRRFLQKKSSKDQILEYDVRTMMTPEIFKKVSILIKEKAVSFDEDRAARASAAASPLANWVKAVVTYYDVARKVQPLQEKVDQLTKTMEQSQQRLERTLQALQLMDAKVVELKENFGRRTAEAESLKITLKKAQDTVQIAQSLLDKLGGERDRWEKQTKELREELKTLPLNALFGAAFTTYLGNAPEDVRRSVVASWCEQLQLRGFNLLKFMSTESEQLKWKAEGLPADGLFMENAVIIKHGIQCPLIIDPSTQAAAWLKQTIKATVEVTTQQDARFTKQLELAVRFGKTLIVQEVDTIEPILFPVLRRDLQREGPRWAVQIGDKLVDYSDNFKLMLVTRNSAPDVTPDAASLISRINFTITKSGLENQLLGLTLQNEQPELEQKKSALLQEEESRKLELSDLERALLDELAASEGAILENKTLVSRLELTKDKSNAIAQKLAEGRRLQESLDSQREVYRPVAAAGAQMFFLIRDLQKASHMYQYSLPMFLQLFTKALSMETAVDTVSARISMLADILQRLVISSVSRSLFKADRLMFGMHFVHGVRPDLFRDNEWEFFSGKLAADASAGGASLPRWAAVERGEAYGSFASIFSGLVSSLALQDEGTWAGWASSPQCEMEFPSRFGKSVTQFQQLLLVQALRPDRLASAMHNFVCSSLGIQSLSPATSTLQRLYEEETRAEEPILLIATAGADPTNEVVEVANKVVGRENYDQVAMGQGQQDVALRLLLEAARNGRWLVLKNLHLVTSWLPTLEKELNALRPHKNFRLWLTTEPHNKFTSILLQSSLKVTFEAPPGVKRNLQRTYESWQPKDISSGTPLRAQLLFALAWFHAIVQERRTYMPQGWTKFYEFSFGDARAGADVIDRVTAGGAVPDWPTIHGLLENAIYGGRVDNNNDLRVLATYIAQFFNSDVVAVPGGRAPSKRLYKDIAMPTSANHQDYMKLINTLPSHDSPSLFTLPANIDRVVQRAQSNGVIAQLKQLSAPMVGAGTAFVREEWTDQLRPIVGLWKQLISQTDMLKARPEPIPDGIDPVQLFVHKEYRVGWELMRDVNTSLSALLEVAKGAALLTAETQRTHASIVAGTVPDKWADKWDGGPSDVYAFLRSLVPRAIALSQWVQRASSGQLLSGPIALSDLLRPETFLNSLRQLTARQMNCAMDTLKLVASWGRSIEGASTTVTVMGMLLQGGSLDGGALQEAPAAAPEVVRAPDMRLAWVPAGTNEPYKANEVVPMPIYFSTARSKLCTEVKVPFTGTKAQWILCGAAFVLRDE